jgi:hypothetical protein
MTGSNSVQFIYQSIDLKDFYVHPVYVEDTSAENTEFEWEVKVDFKVIKQTPKWDIIKVAADVVLRKQDDKMKVSKLIVESTFKVFTRLSFDIKYKTAGLFINAVIGQLQGGWHVLHTNPVLKKMIPQALFHENVISQDLKKTIFEKWK